MYNLPSGGGGGGGGGGDNPLKEILPGLLSIIGIILFFSSPLGGVFFAITNSLFLLALLTPIVLIVGFNIWQSLNTIEGPCPNCSTSVRVMKSDNVMEQTSICFNCGSLIRANEKRDGVELCNDPGSMFSDGGGGSMGGGSPFDDIFGSSSFGSSSFGNERNDRKGKSRREQTVIDVDVERDD